MSIVNIRAALEVALGAVTPVILTVYENDDFEPPAPSVPYQFCFILFARPDNAEIRSGHQEVGYMQVSLRYPQQAGSGAAAARAELLRSTFKRGNTFTSGPVKVVITDTPEIARGEDEESRYVLNVVIRFRSQVN